MYQHTHCDEILPGDNVIVGLGDSFTQGVGTYDLETWASIPEKPSMPLDRYPKIFSSGPKVRNGSFNLNHLRSTSIQLHWQLWNN